MDITVDRKSKILFVGMLLIIVGTIYSVYYFYFAHQTYPVVYKMSCVESDSQCFVEGEGSDAEKYYIYKYSSATTLGNCDQGGCQKPPACTSNNDCEVFHCTSENLKAFSLEAAHCSN